MTSSGSVPAASGGESPWTFGGVSDIRKMQQVAARAWAVRPDFANVGATVGELAWIGGRNLDLAQWFKCRVWTEGSDPIAFGWVWPPYQLRVSETSVETAPASLTWQVDPTRVGLVEEVLSWFDELVPEGPKDTHARTHDVEAVTALKRRGYVMQDGPWHYMNTRSLEHLEEPRLPDGFRFLTMETSGDVEAFVQGHCTAWQSTDLTVAAYEHVMATPPYQPELDVAVSDKDGVVVARATGWLDAQNKTIALEPVGTDPAQRRQGLGRAINLFALHAGRAAGATTGVVGCRGDSAYPVPEKLYRSVGFGPISRDSLFRHP